MYVVFPSQEQNEIWKQKKKYYIWLTEYDKQQGQLNYLRRISMPIRGSQGSQQNPTLLSVFNP